MNTKLALVPCVLLSACVTSGTHEAVVAELAQTRSKLDDTGKKQQDCDTNLTTALDQNKQLIDKVSSMGQNVEQLLGEKGELAKQRERLEGEQKALAKEVDELKRMRAATEARNAEFKTLLSKLHKMIDAGKLQVKIRNGAMVVRMSSDVVFPPGGTRIKPEAYDAIVQLAQTLAQFKERKFQVLGHSDPTPINSARFPSNWELSSQRAIEVVKLLIENGMPPETLSAAGSAEFDPLVGNDTPEGMSQNRRVEVVLLPKIDELPGFDQALTAK